MDTNNVILMPVQPAPKHYCVHTDTGVVRVRANSYSATNYGTYAFYKEGIEEVNKAAMKGGELASVYEVPRRNVESITEEGVSENVVISRKKSPKKTKTKSAGDCKSKTTASVLKKSKQKS
jgi:hypothetical protein